MKVEYFFSDFDGLKYRITKREAMVLVTESMLDMAVVNYKRNGDTITRYRVMGGMLSIVVSE